MQPPFELKLFHFGNEICKPLHSWGPSVRDHYLIHYIVEGTGRFVTRGIERQLHQGQGFLICPNVIAHYEADAHSPWSYRWVGFHGSRARELITRTNMSEDSPIFLFKSLDDVNERFRLLEETSHRPMSADLHQTSLLYTLLAELIEKSETEHLYELKQDWKSVYIAKATEYIHTHYAADATISGMSEYVGINRKYLSAIFNSRLHVTPQQFLINYRMNRAIELMGNPSLGIGDISRSVGYRDPLLFSRTFRKCKGMSPKQYRSVCNSGPSLRPTLL